jgi:hypothetical protein
MKVVSVDDLNLTLTFGVADNISCDALQDIDKKNYLIPLKGVYIVR